MDPSTIIESLDENCVSNVLIFVEEILRAKQNEEAAQEFREACAKYTSSQDTPAVVRELMRHADVILAHEDESGTCRAAAFARPCRTRRAQMWKRHSRAYCASYFPSSTESTL
jgi:hypothetical protein